MFNQTPAGMPGLNGLFSRNDGFPSLPGMMEGMLGRSMQVARGGPDPAGDSIRRMLPSFQDRMSQYRQADIDRYGSEEAARKAGMGHFPGWDYLTPEQQQEQLAGKGWEANLRRKAAADMDKYRALQDKQMEDSFNAPWYMR
jgi:hypothetical protein